MENLISNKYSKNTKRNVNAAVQLLKDFSKTKSMNTPIEELTCEEMDDLLKQFYASVRKNDGELLKKSSLQGIYYGIKHYLRETKKWDLDDIVFNKSKEMFQCLLKDLKAKGKGKTDHYPLICKQELHTIISNLSTENPVELQWLVWFLIQFYFCRRGAENVAFMTKDTFQIIVIGDKRCIIQKLDEMTKNHRENDNEPSIGGRIYETCTSNCPVTTFQTYLNKLNPNCNRLWQKPNTNFRKTSIWYNNCPLGVNTISKFMKQISIHARLPKVYTNHSIRVSSITLLSSQFSENEILGISGHQSIASLGTYKRIGEECKERMSDYLSSGLHSIKSTLSNSVPKNNLKRHLTSIQNNSKLRRVNEEPVIPSKIDLDETIPCVDTELSPVTSTSKMEIKKSFHMNPKSPSHVTFNNCSLIKIYYGSK